MGVGDTKTDDLQTWTTNPDKAAWGQGAWVDEPDKAQWTDQATGLPCLAKRNRSGAWCGYVGIPAGHPLHGLDHDDDRLEGVEVHGGLTYADGCQEDDRPIEERICHIPGPGEPDNVWWFGFDCGHSMDLSPALEARTRQLGLSMPEYSMPEWMQSHYRTFGYVRDECTTLAKALAERA